MPSKEPLNESELWTLIVAAILLLGGIYYSYMGFIEVRPEKPLYDTENQKIKKDMKYQVTEKSGSRYQNKSEWKVSKQYQSKGSEIIKKEVNKNRFLGGIFFFGGIIASGYLILKRKYRIKRKERNYKE